MSDLLFVLSGLFWLFLLGRAQRVRYVVPPQMHDVRIRRSSPAVSVSQSKRTGPAAIAASPQPAAIASTKRLALPPSPTAAIPMPPAQGH